MRAILVLGLLAVAARHSHAAPPVFDDVSALDGLFIVNETISDNPVSPAVPNPVTWNAAVAADFDFRPVSIYVSSQATPRDAGGGITKISPSFGYTAWHARGTGTVGFLTAANVEIVRTYTVERIPQATDLALVRFNAPVADEDIPSAAILTDISCLGGELVAALEHDRHVNVMTAASTPGGGSLPNTAVETYVWRPAVDGDAIEGGDSSKPAASFINGQMAVAMTGFYTIGAEGGNVWGRGPNPSNPPALAAIASRVQAAGETLTLINSSEDPEPPLPPPNPGRYHLTTGVATVTVGGLPLTFDIPE
jgi:hypothetical protein